MKVLNISYDDYANFAFENAQALNSIDVKCISLKKVKHPFGYRQESLLSTDQQIKKHIDNADVVQFFHSYAEYLNYALDKGKRCFVYHTGTNYRRDPEVQNQIFNPYVERCFTDQCEFIGLGMKNETYIATAIDTDRIKPLDWNVTEPYTIAHFPSNPSVKGTQKIGEMLSRMERPYKYITSSEKVTNSEQLKRMSMCDIYIELFAPTLHGKPYGCYGVTAFEAAALGKTVITNNIHEDVYSNNYGQSALFIANTEQDFLITLDTLLSASQTLMRSLQNVSRDWVREKHSYVSTGIRIAHLLSIKL